MVELTRKTGISWMLQLALVAIPACVPAIVTAYFSYKSSKADAEAAYQATVEAVKELQEAARELKESSTSKDMAIAKMQGALETMEHMFARVPVRRELASGSPPNVEPREIRAPPPVQLKPMPQNIDQAREKQMGVPK